MPNNQSDSEPRDFLEPTSMPAKRLPFIDHAQDAA
jgi:hypothetical protein